MAENWWHTGLCALALALIHLFAGKLTFISMIPRSKWLSFGGGVSVAYVFIHVLPELEEWQIHFESDGFFQHHLYLFSLGGLALFYGLERLAKLSKASAREREGRKHHGSPGVFYIHLASFTVYNALVGYLLVHREDHELKQLIFYLLAMGSHFIINDFGLDDHYHHRYRRMGRYMLSGAIMAGWLAGVFTKISPVGVGVLFGILSGGVILNTLKEELPEERRSNYLAFIGGCMIYSAILLLV